MPPTKPNFATLRRIFIAAFVLVFVSPVSFAFAQSDADVRRRCLETLREGLASDEFWPSIHAAEALTLAGRGDEVRRALLPRLEEESDDQRRCGLARELVRAGDRGYASVMFEILKSSNPHGHVHAAESLFKVFELDDGRSMRAAMNQKANSKLRLMAAAALGRSGSPVAMQVLRRSLSHGEVSDRQIAAWVLGRIGDADDLPALRANLQAIEDPLVRAYHEHALAALGDPHGREKLRANLVSEDPAIRTYAATFAGDARMTETRPRLAAMLDDEHLDARLRAAQSWLTLTSPAPAVLERDVSELVYAASTEHPRYTEGSILPLRDGTLLFAVTEFSNSGSDFATANIVGRQSRDGGKTWGEPRILQKNSGKLNVMSVTLRRLAAKGVPATTAMFYLEKNSYNDLHVFVRFSTDEAKTFGPPRPVTREPGYHVLNNDRVTQLQSGRLVVPVAMTTDVRKVNHFVSYCYLSDDGGRTWKKGRGKVDLPKRGAMEPEVVELRDGRLMMILRNQLGYISKAYSEDAGDTWGPAKSMGVRSPEAPATIRRIPSTGDLVLVWNDTYQAGAGHGGKRTPLTIAVSSDEGETWKNKQNLESDPQRTYSYTSVSFCRGRILLTYWESDPKTSRLSCRFRSLPVSFLY